MALTFVGVGLAVTAGTASASCALQKNDALNEWRSDASATLMTGIYYVPASGTCNDINIRMVSRGGQNYSSPLPAVTLYLHMWSKDGKKDYGYVSSKTFNGKYPSSWWVARKSAPAGTKFRVEAPIYLGGGPWSPYGWVVGIKA